MRLVTLLIVILLNYCAISSALPLHMKVLPINGKSSYQLHTDDNVNEQDAKILQKQINEAVNQLWDIKPGNSHNNYMLRSPIIDEYAKARSIENDLQKIQYNKKDNQQGSDSQDIHKKDINPQTRLWNLRNANIRAVIEEVSKVTGKNFIIDPKVQGNISIISNTPIDSNALYEMFLSSLQMAGYIAVPGKNAVKIIPNMDARSEPVNINNRLQDPPLNDEMMVEVVPIHYVSSEQLVPALRPLLPQWSNISAYAPSNMLILSGRASNIRELSQIIRQVDASSSNDIDIIKLHDAIAMDVVNTLKDMVRSQHLVNIQNQPFLAADDRSNSVLLSGNKTDRIRLRLLISQLDAQNANGMNKNTQVIYLNYLRAEDIVPILAGIAQANFSGIVGTTIGTVTRPALDSTDPNASLIMNPGGNSSDLIGAGNNAQQQHSNSNSNTPQGGSSTQSEGSSKPSVQIIAEPNTNSVILNAPASLIRTLKQVINQLDIKPAQLLVEALVVEINETDFNSLGIEWGSINQKTHDPDSFRAGFAIINSKASIDQLQAQIYALERTHKANILSTPSVVVLDNRQAKILIGKQVSVASSSYPNNANATTTASPYTTFDRVNVALHLYVRPQITRGKGIQLQIDQGNDTLDVTNIVDPGTTPTFNISSIVTSVHVESGDVVVLGGLVQDSLADDSNNLPILSDIPGIGRLFQHNSTNREKKVLMVFIRPKILNDEKTAVNITQGKYADLRQYQLDFLREQEAYKDDNKATVLPRLNTEVLPKPFTNTQTK